eukprot:1914273-Prymnesium_polylepis.2
MTSLCEANGTQALLEACILSRWPERSGASGRTCVGNRRQSCRCVRHPLHPAAGACINPAQSRCRTRRCIDRRGEGERREAPALQHGMHHRAGFVCGRRVPVGGAVGRMRKEDAWRRALGNLAAAQDAMQQQGLLGAAGFDEDCSHRPLGRGVRNGHARCAAPDSVAAVRRQDGLGAQRVARHIITIGGRLGRIHRHEVCIIGARQRADDLDVRRALTSKCHERVAVSPCPFTGEIKSAAAAAANAAQDSAHVTRTPRAAWAAASTRRTHGRRI